MMELMSTNIKTREMAVAQFATHMIYVFRFENIFLFKLLLLIDRRRLKQMKKVCVTDARIATERTTVAVAQNIGFR